MAEDEEDEDPDDRDEEVVDPVLFVDEFDLEDRLGRLEVLFVREDRPWSVPDSEFALRDFRRVCLVAVAFLEEAFTPGLLLIEDFDVFGR